MTENIPAPSAPRWPAYLAWAVILLGAGLIIYRNQLRESAARAESPTTPVEKFQITLAGKYAVGAKAMMGTSQPTAPNLHNLLTPIDLIAKTDEQKLAAAVVAGELDGKDAALRRIEQVAAQPQVPPEIQQDTRDLHTIYSAGPNTLDQAAQSRLTAKYGYFGQVALSFGVPDSDPRRKSVLQQGEWIVNLTLVLTILGAIGAFVVVGLSMTAIVLFSLGKIRPAYLPQPRSPTVYVEMFAVYLASFLLLSWILNLLTQGVIPLALMWAITPVVAIAIGWGLLRGQSWPGIRQALGWNGGRGWYIEVLLGITGYFAGLPIVVLGYAIMYLLIYLSGAMPSHPIVSETDHRSVAQILLTYSIASLWALAIEETMFRGALFHHLRQRWGWLISTTVVAFLFAVIHPQGWAAVPALMAIAIVLAGLREWRGSILAPMAAHAFHNGVLITLLLLMS